MKLVALGAVLVIYAIFFSPCFIEPSDVLVSTGYIVIANEMGLDPFVIWLWVMSGYVALFGGVALGFGGTFIHFKHPLVITLLIMVFAGILSYWFLFFSGWTNI